MMNGLKTARLAAFVLGFAAAVCASAPGLAARSGGGRSVRFQGPHEELIRNHARRVNLPSSLLRAVIKTESGFNRFAVSPMGAKGLMQLMPETCGRYGVTDPFDPEQNIRAGSSYLREMIDRFQHLTLALAAYNSGPETVEQHQGVPPIDETRAFIKSVYLNYNAFRRRIDKHAPQFVPDWPKYEKKESNQ